MSSHSSTGGAECREQSLAAVAFGSHLREWRKKNKVLRKQLAADLGMSLSTVSAWENGTRFPSGVHCDLVASYLEQPVFELFHNEDGTGRRMDGE